MLLWVPCLWLLLGPGGAERGGPAPSAPHAPPPSLGHDPEHRDGFGADQEAFLGGGEEAKEFLKLRPEESKRRLRQLLGHVDADGDGHVTVSELRQWLERGRSLGRMRSVERALREHDRDRDGALTWEEFRGEAYGDAPLSAPSRLQLARHERRFRSADGDGDGAVRGEELEAFLHPGDCESMRGVVVMETIEDMDKNGDGLIQEDEYIADLWDAPPGSPEPHWLQQERVQFRQHRDQDGDGALGPAELSHWLRPPEPDWAQLEAEHLLHHTDRDGDRLLTEAEVMANWEMFVGSQGTNYGEDLELPHDEL
ncbi:reticulocalbin-3-like [Melopsittacus undulatus]|uniref:reticulocalbin-3-like n=1 Tax=Melopsittacus undulatus TaxID=13146 RepID=UPI00146CF47C|nr:reticulocalbin-3-like [Melopsittacus undulatus]